MWSPGYEYEALGQRIDKRSNSNYLKGGENKEDGNSSLSPSMQKTSSLL